MKTALMFAVVAIVVMTSSAPTHAYLGRWFDWKISVGEWVT